MMLVFPLVYISSFLISLRDIIRGKRESVVLFLILALPIYITSLSVTFSFGLNNYIKFLQPLKELIVIFLLGTQIWTLQGKIRLHKIDFVVIAFFFYTFLYALLPIGEQSFSNRLIAFKSLSFFPLIYFSGRLFDFRKIYLSKYFHLILLAGILAASVTLFEVFFSQHFQTLTGYADYNYYVFNVEPTGSYGLSYTFESEGGFKRFASFFANPLEHAAATLLALAVLAAVCTTDNNKFRFNNFTGAAFVATGISILLALSRSPMVGYFLIIYVYALINKRKQILYAINLFIMSLVLYFFYWINNKDIQELILNTINFSNPSSVGHVLEWIEGVNSMIKNPLGIGLGTSGRVGGSFGETTGGENQFLIVGVQTGIIAVIIYLFIYYSLIKESWNLYPTLKGKEKKLCLALLLMKVGFITPFLTSELESSSYISYITWFFSGLFVGVIAQKKSSNPSIRTANDN